MLKTIRSILVAAGLIGSPQTAMANEGNKSAQDTVRLFAETFLSPEAAARLRNPITTNYEVLDLMEVDTSAHPDQLEDSVCGQVLLDEMLNYSNRAVWLDWKYNILTLIRDDAWDDQLGLVFEMNTLAPLTPEERAPILEKALKEHGERPEVMMFPDLQPLAEKRGYRLMIFENRSDGLGLFALPADQAAAWHMTHLGDVLIIDAAAGSVADPRSNGRINQLTN